MQIFALNENGKRLAASCAARQKDYICLECSGKVRLRGGKRKQLHFYHTFAPSFCRQNGKSKEHLAVQQWIQKLICQEDVTLEHPFPTICRIADVVWHSRKIIFEIQCSLLPVEEVKKRNKDYAQLGYQVIWILHDRTFNRYRLSTIEEFLKTSPHYYTNINALGKGMVYDQLSIDRGGKRLKRSLPLPIKVQCPRFLLIPKQFSRHLRPFLEERFWPVYFSGDAIDRSATLKVPLSFRHKKTYTFWHFIKRECKDLFHTIFYIFLEKTSD